MSIPAFEVSTDQLNKLNYFDFQELVGRLCAAEAKESGISKRVVEYGEPTNAADGGIDILFDLSSAADIPNTYPEGKIIGFQVKASDLKLSGVKSAVHLKGANYQRIQTLLNDPENKYILVGKTVASKIQKNNALKAEISTRYAANENQAEYYDLHDIQKWLTYHPEVQLWVKDKLGISDYGWKPRGLWGSNSNEADFIHDLDEPRVEFLGLKEDNILNTALGIEKFRNQLLLLPSIRVIGQSGVGKTRFVAEVFNSILNDPSFPIKDVFYTDNEAIARPHPKHLIEDLIKTEQSCVILIDNCSLELHNELTDTLKTLNICNIKLVTINLDISEKGEHGANIVWLKRASNDAITKFMELNADPSESAHSRIIALADGNFRLAKFLASGVKTHNPNWNKLNDRDFRSRLLANNPSLQQNESVLQLISVVFSFNDQEEQPSEFEILCNLFDEKPLHVKQSLKILKDLEIVQHRGTWNALLPVPLANHYCYNAFQILKPLVIYKYLQDHKKDRLVTSMLRRCFEMSSEMNFQELSNYWWEQNREQLLLPNWDYELGKQLNYIIPLDKDISLMKIKELLCEKRVTTKLLSQFHQSLVQIAYEDKYFIECAHCILKIEIHEKFDLKKLQGRGDLKSLFRSRLSNTQAHVSTRLKFLNDLSNDYESNKDLIFKLFDNLLYFGYVTGNHLAPFGNEIRDYGFIPRYQTEYDDWINHCLMFIESLQNNFPESKQEIGKSLANALEYNFNQENYFSKFVLIGGEIAKSGFWFWGWAGVLRTIKDLYGAKQNNHPKLAELLALKIEYGPKTLDDEIDVYVIQKFQEAYNFAFQINTDEETVERIENGQYQLNLGIRWFQAGFTISQLASKLSEPGKQSTHFYHYIGKGYFSNTESASTINELTTLIQCTTELKLSSFFHGCIQGIHEAFPEKETEFSENLIASESVKQNFQSIWLDRVLLLKDQERILNAIEKIKLQKEDLIWFVRRVLSNHVDYSNPFKDQIWTLIINSEQLKQVAFELAVYNYRQENFYFPSKFHRPVAELFFDIPFETSTEKNDISDYDLSLFIGILDPSKLENWAIKVMDLLCEDLNALNPVFSGTHYSIKAIEKKWPEIALTKYFDTDWNQWIWARPGIKSQFIESALINPTKLLEWITQKAEVRLQRIIEAIQWFRIETDSIHVSEIGKILLKSSLDKEVMLESIVNELTRVPTFGHETKLEILVKREPIFEDLKRILDQHDLKLFPKLKNLYSSRKSEIQRIDSQERALFSASNSFE